MKAEILKVKDVCKVFFVKNFLIRVFEVFKIGLISEHTHDNRTGCLGDGVLVSGVKEKFFSRIVQKGTDYGK